MTIHTPVRPPRIVAPGGPVSAAIRAMRADEPATDYARIRELRRAIADRIEADIALLDALAGDPDFEGGDDDEPWLGSIGGTAEGIGFVGQLRWAAGATDDREHDGADGPEGDDEREPDVDGEPSLCGITANSLFATGAAMCAHDSEPSLASLGGTAEGCDQSQAHWSAGDHTDKGEDTGSKAHRREGLWREPGQALDDARAWARKTRYGRRDYVTIAGPHGGTYLCRATGRR